jgi:hypothetical protein
MRHESYGRRTTDVAVCVASLRDDDRFGIKCTTACSLVSLLVSAILNAAGSFRYKQSPGRLIDFYI